MAAIVLSVCTPSIGQALVTPADIVVQASGDLLVTDTGLVAVVRVDPATGNEKIISGAGTGVGPAFSIPRGIAVEASGDLIVVDHGLPLLAAIRVDPVTGDRTIVSDGGTGSGPTFSIPHGIAVKASGDLVVADHGIDSVFRVDPVTGDRSILSDPGTGTGPFPFSSRGIAVEASGDVLVVDVGLDAVVRVDPATGDRTIVSDAGTGAGPAFLAPIDIAVEASGDLVVVDINLDAVIRVDPVTGDRAIISDGGTGAGPVFFTPVGIAVEATGGLVVTDDGRDAVLRVDPVTGDRAIIELECPTAPVSVCSAFAEGQFRVNERGAGRERLLAKLKRGPEIAQADFGNPTGTERTAFALCVYDDADEKVAGLVVDQAGEVCGTKPCWKAIGGDPPTGKGYVYRDKDASSSGVSKMTLKGGGAGKSKLLVGAANNVAKGQTALPTGIAAALSSAASVKVQIITDDGRCFGATLSDITKQQSDLFKAK